MKYFSEILKKTFDSEKECLEAEKAHNEKMELAERQKKELAEKRKERAKEVEEAYKAVKEARKHYNELVDSFCKDYGAFHMTFTSKDNDWDSLFDELFRIF